MRRLCRRFYYVLVVLSAFLLLTGLGVPVLAEKAVLDPPNTPEGMAAAPSAGFTIKVNTLVDEWSTDTNTKAQSQCSLREALQATVTSNPQGNQGCGSASIANFDEYSLNLMPGTYLLTRNEQLPNITKKIVIDGKNTVTINGGGNNGRSDGIFIVASGQLQLIKLKLQYGKRPFGGAIWIKGAGSAQASEVEFYRNLADNGVGNGDGGAVAVDTGSFICVKSKFNENTARHAGGVQVLVDRCEFFRNHAEVNGGDYAGFGGSETTHPITRDRRSLFIK
jgi:CSLREA domain-containing protein